MCGKFFAYILALKKYALQSAYLFLLEKQFLEQKAPDSV